MRTLAPVTVLAALVASSGAPSRAECIDAACFCEPDPVGGKALRELTRRRFEDAQAVFVGRVEAMPPALDGRGLARLRVLEWWKGGPGDTITVLVHPMAGGITTCDLTLDVRRAYLLFAYRGPDDRLAVGKCSGSAAKADADSTLVVLERLAPRRR